jgi:hypothetical protein
MTTTSPRHQQASQPESCAHAFEPLRTRTWLYNKESDPESALKCPPTAELGVDRGIQIARGLAAKPALYRTLQKQTLNLNLRRRITQDVPFGMALEGLTAADLAYQNST